MKYKIIEPNTQLYRFIDKEPSDVNINFDNTELNGRFNKNQFVYYCSISMEDMLEEAKCLDKNLYGSLIVAEVIEPIILLYPTREIEYNFSRAICSSSPTSKVAEQFAEKIPYFHINNYNDTNIWFTNLIRNNPGIDGIGYPCANGINIVKNNILYYLSDTNNISPYIQNIALIRQGFNKIKCKQPVVYWHNTYRKEV